MCTINNYNSKTILMQIGCVGPPMENSYEKESTTHARYCETYR